jgi:replicative DNA helicase
VTPARRDHRPDALRIPPQSIESEQSVLGGLMLVGDKLATLSLQPEDFYRRDHQTIYRAIQDMDRKGQPFDAVTLAEWFESQGLGEQVAGGAYLVELVGNTPSAANIHAYAAIVRDKALLRQAIEAGTGVVSEAFDPHGDDAATVIERGISALMALQKSQSRHEFSLRDAIKAAMDDMHAAYASDGALRGITSGFGKLDARLGGFHPGDLVFVGARPKMGKTAMLVNMGYSAAKAGHPVGIISGEQSALQLAQRFLALETAIAGERMRNGTLEDEDWSKLTTAVRSLLERRVSIYDAGGPSIDHVRRIARKWKKEHGIQALYVDYLQRIKSRAKDRTEEVGDVARGLKDIARDLDIPVIALAQVKRDVESRVDKRPTAADIANSDEATREADQILMLYRDEVYNENSPDKGIAELNLEANRHGPTGMFRLAWMRESMRFADLAETHW